MGKQIDFAGHAKHSTGFYLLRSRITDGCQEVFAYFRSEARANEELRKSNRYYGGGFYLSNASAVSA